MKIFLGVLVLILSTLIGYKLSEKYVLRKKFYTDFASFNEKLTREVSFLQTTILSLIKENEMVSDFSETLMVYIKEEKFIFSKKYLNEEEIEYFKKYLGVIGSVDRALQITFLNTVSYDLKGKLTVVADDEKKYKTLYLKLGFLTGLIALILLL